jgi:hypothetical protein
MTYPALDEALRELAEGPSNAASVRRTLDRSREVRSRNRTLVALVGAAAAVALIISAIGLVTVSRNNSEGVATPPDWRRDPAVIVPAGSQLVPYDAAPLRSPVTVTAGGPPAGVVPERTFDVDYVKVSWPNADNDSPAFRGSLGYQVDRSAVFGQLTSTIGEQLAEPVPVTTVPTTIGGHPAEFGRAPAGTKLSDGVGGLVRIWFTWQLSDGSYLHVWNVADDKAALDSLAGGIVEKPTTFDSFIDLGVTAPGLTARYSQGVRFLNQRATAPLDETVVLCPTGTPAVRTRSAALSLRCLSAEVEPTAPTYSPDPILPDGTHVLVNGMLVHVLAGQHRAWADLGRGYRAVVRAPATMSTADLAFVVTTVRLDPRIPAAPVEPSVTPAQPSVVASARPSAGNATSPSAPASR